MLTTEKETDYPVALVTCDEKPCELLYYSDEYIPVRKPPAKLMRMMEEYVIEPPGYEVFECDFPMKRCNHSSDQMRGSPCS